MNGGPAGFAVVLKTGDICAEKRGEFAGTAAAGALVAHLVVQNVRLHLHPLVDVAVLKLNETRRNCSDVALLGTSPFVILSAL